MDLASKVVVVLGGGAGIGRAGALAFAATGARVLVADIDESAAIASADAIVSAAGQAVSVHCDIASTMDLENVRQQAISTYGRVDIVWIHAGKAIAGALEQIEIDVWQRLLDINCMGAVRAFQVFTPDFLERGDGHFVLTSSSLALFPEQLPVAAAYVMTKSAVTGFGRALRAYLEPRGVGVTLLFPDATLTDHATKLPLVGLDEVAFRKELDPSVMDSPEKVAGALVEGLRADLPAISLTPNVLARIREADEALFGASAHSEVTVVVEGQLAVGPQMHGRLAAALRAVAVPTLQEPGNRAYRWTSDLDQPGVFWLFEEWESPAALDRHASSQHGVAFLAALAELGPSTADLRIRDALPPQALVLPD